MVPRGALRLGLTAEQAERRLGDLVFAFEPGDLIAETMSLGSPADRGRRHRA